MIWVTANASPKDLNMYASLVPVCFFLFYILTHVCLKERPIYPRLHVIGMFMFYLHLAVKEQMELGFNHLQQYNGIYCWDKFFIVTLVVTVLASVGLEWLSHKKKFTWITWLY